MNENNQLGRAIREARKSRNMTQTELAKKLNVTGVSIGRWEQGLRIPRPAMIEKISSVLGVTSAALFGYEGVNQGMKNQFTLGDILDLLERGTVEITVHDLQDDGNIPGEASCKLWAPMEGMIVKGISPTEDGLDVWIEEEP